MNQGRRYLEALEGAVRYTVEGSVLQVHQRDPELPLRFTRIAGD